jgi:hypothetical protein
MTTNKLKDFQNKFGDMAFGVDVQASKQFGRCIDCGENAEKNCYSEAGKREFKISGLCEKCFDRIMHV